MSILTRKAVRMWVLITRYGYIGVTNLQPVAVNLHWCYNSLQEYGKEEKTQTTLMNRSVISEEHLLLFIGFFHFQNKYIGPQVLCIMYTKEEKEENVREMAMCLSVVCQFVSYGKGALTCRTDCQTNI